jgi:hypothetical protein
MDPRVESITQDGAEFLADYVASVTASGAKFIADLLGNVGALVKDVIEDGVEVVAAATSAFVPGREHEPEESESVGSEDEEDPSER